MHDYSKNARERVNTALTKDGENGGNVDLSSINGENEMSEEDFKLKSGKREEAHMREKEIEGVGKLMNSLGLYH